MIAPRLGPLGPAARLAVRTTVAGVLTYAVATGLALPQAYWAVMTALIVVQGSVGGTLAAGLDRMAGTLGGAALGALVALAQPTLGLPDGAALAVAIAPLAMLAARQPRFRVAPLTAAIILLGSPPEVAPLLAATHRVLEILLGSLIGLGVSLLVLPARAHAQLMRHTAEVLGLLGELAERHLAAAASAPDQAAIERLSERYRRLLAAAETAALEARRERTSRLTDAPAPEPAVRVVRRLRSDVAHARAAPRCSPCRLHWRCARHPASRRWRPRCAPSWNRPPQRSRPTRRRPIWRWSTGRSKPSWQAGPRSSRDRGRGERRPMRESAARAPFAVETLRRDLGDLVAIPAVLAGIASTASPDALREQNGP